MNYYSYKYKKDMSTIYGIVKFTKCLIYSIMFSTVFYRTNSQHVFEPKRVGSGKRSKGKYR